MEQGVNECEKGVVVSGTDKRDVEVCTNIGGSLGPISDSMSEGLGGLFQREQLNLTAL